MPGSTKKLATWFLTYPQSGDLSLDRVKQSLCGLDEVKEYLIALEKHQDGSNHSHAYVKFKTGVTKKAAVTAFDVDGHHGNYQCVRSCKAVVQYCTKDGNYISNFDVDKYQAKKGKITSYTLRTYTAIEALDAGIVGVNSLKAYEYARSLAIVPKARDDVCGVWIHGSAGTGKSRYARHLAGDDVYLKAQNKWWDGYVGQESVLLEDLDKAFQSWHNMKIWTDRYPCSGEIKGGQVSLSYDRFIVTSNYLPDVLIHDDNPLLEAIYRRFKFIPFEEGTWEELMGYPLNDDKPPAKKPKVEPGSYFQLGFKP